MLLSLGRSGRHEFEYYRHDTLHCDRKTIHWKYSDIIRRPLRSVRTHLPCYIPSHKPQLPDGRSRTFEVGQPHF